jgi:hypothetical protein
MQPTRLNPRIMILIPLLMAAAGGAVIWDSQRLDENFRSLYLLLRTARLDALYKRTTIVVLFDGDRVVVSDRKNSKFTTTTIPMIERVEYDTTLGKDMIVYDWQGTSAYNKREHGGEIMLRSLLGFRRYIHVNCNGVVREGRYPEGE